MKRLAVMRHAEAEASSIDYQRPLSSYGELQSAESAKLLKEHFTPQEVLVSGALRTRMTAGVVGNVYGFDEGVFKFDDRIYESSVMDLSYRIQEVDNSIENLMLIGHNPGVSMLVSALSGQRCRYSPGTFALIEFQADDWKKLGQGTLLHHYSPA